MTLIFERKFRFFCTKAQRLNQYSKFISFKNGKMLLKQHYHGTDRFGKETASFPMSPINAQTYRKYTASPGHCEIRVLFLVFIPKKPS